MSAVQVATEQLLRNGSVERLIDATAKKWGSHDRAAVEDVVYKQLALAYSACRADEPGGVYAWLRKSVHGRMCDLHTVECGRERILRGVAAGAGETFADPPDVELTRAANVELVTELLTVLSERDRRIVRLAWGEGERRADIAGSLGVSERLVKKVLERAGKKLQARLVDQVGGGCGQPGELLVRAQAFHLAISDADRASALVHSQACGACATLQNKLQQVLAAAAVAPAPVVADPGTAERTVHRLSGVASWAREQIAAAHNRVYELSSAPPPVRPGALVATLGACAMAAGGTYCVDQALPPLGVLNPPAHEQPETQKPAKVSPEQQRAVSPTLPNQPLPERATTPAAEPPAPSPAAKPATQPTPQPAPPPSQAAPSAPAPQRDFEIEQSRPSTPATPAPAPVKGGGEFL